MLKSLVFGIMAVVLGLGMGLSVADEFAGTPPTPQPLVSHGEFANYDVQIHSRDEGTWSSLQSMQAQHGAGCEGPPASHENHTYEGAVFVCNNHVMTSLRADAYGLIYLTPNSLLDCSSGSCSVQWEMSTEKMSLRDWWDLTLTPYEDNLALPLLSDLSETVDLQGPARNTIHIGGDNAEGAPILTVLHDGDRRYFGEGWNVPSLDQGIGGSVNQAATRQTFKLSISGSNVRFERLASATAPALVYQNRTISNLPLTDSMVVQFGHHSYTPTKDNAGVPGTWHWDELKLSPSVPFTLIKANERRTTGGVVTFKAPAPANAMLRFSAIGKVTVNGQGVSPVVPTVANDHHNSYFVPIPVGTKQVTIGLTKDAWYQGPFQAKDFSIWSTDRVESVAPSVPSNSSGTTSLGAVSGQEPTSSLKQVTSSVFGSASRSWWAVFRLLAFGLE